jgi:N-acetylmuramoyl-L-alanine amidase
MSLLLLAAVSVTAKAAAQEISLPHDLPGRQVIVLDPAHGGHDPGAVGPSGLAEKDVALVLAEKVRDALSPDYTVFLTRDGDYWLDIERRTAMANHHRADVFISFHAGGSPHHKTHGMAVFCYGLGTGQGLSPESVGPVGEGGKTLSSWDQIQLRHTAKSNRLANLLHDELVARLNHMDRGVQTVPCLVLRGADMPAVLVEIGYVSHPSEEQALKDPESMSAFAEAISQSIREFFGEGKQN